MHRLTEQIQMITGIERLEIAHVVGKKRRRQNDRADDDRRNPEDSPAFLRGGATDMVEIYSYSEETCLTAMAWHSTAEL